MLRIPSRLSLAVLAVFAVGVGGCIPPSETCPEGGFEDGKAAIRLAGEGAIQAIHDGQVPDLEDLSAGAQSLYRASPELYCPDYDVEFIRGMIVGAFEIIAEQRQSRSDPQEEPDPNQAE